MSASHARLFGGMPLFTIDRLRALAYTPERGTMPSAGDIANPSLVDRLFGHSRFERAVTSLSERAMDMFSGGTGRTFFDSAEFPWVAGLEANWRIIRRELDSVMRSLEEISSGQAYITHDKGWKTFFLRTYHLGLIVPEPASRCGIRVGRDVACWQDGKSLIFARGVEQRSWAQCRALRRFSPALAASAVSAEPARHLDPGENSLRTGNSGKARHGRAAMAIVGRRATLWRIHPPATVDG